jgi:hypothetical protein
MSFLTSLFGAGDTVEKAGKAFDELFTSDDERNQARIMLEKLNQKPLILQAELNKIEAGHRSIFVAGWRPAIGWVCALALFCFYIPKFLLATIVWVVAIHQGGWVDIPAYPVEAHSLFELVLALLGMATIRTVEKAKGLTK